MAMRGPVKGRTSAVETRPASRRRSVVGGRRSLGPLLATGLLVLGVACAAAGPAPTPRPEPPAPEPRFPAVEPGAPASPAAEAETAGILALARDTLAAGHPSEALSLAEQVVSRYPGAPGSAEALWILARAALELERPLEAAEAAGAFAGRLPDDHPLKGRARLFQARALLSEGERGRAVDALLRVPAAAADSVRSAALERIRETVTRLDYEELQELDEGGQEGAPRLRAPLLAEVALARFGRGETEAAARTARAALDAGASGPEEEIAQQVLAGDVTVARRQAAVLGVLLPESGSPGQQQFATLVRDGILARLESGDRGRGAPVRLEIADDQGSPQVADSLVRALGTGGALAILGPLTDRTLASAARARFEPVPMISPTATRVPFGEPAVYTLRGPDPGASRSLARYAISSDLREAVVLHGPSDESRREAQHFIRSYEDEGGFVLRNLSFQEGATFFEGLLRTVRDLRPATLVLPMGAREIELLAPQLTYFGLDTLGIRFLGTAEWAEPGVLQGVSQRHTDGFVVATPRVPGGPTEAYLRFVRDYETVLRKTLRSRIPGLGYDAAGLMLEALATGSRSPRRLREALEEIQGFPGATGILSVEDGAIRREHHLVRIRDGGTIPIPLERSREPVLPTELFPGRRPVPPDRQGEPRP